jgi:dihydropyrimidine dehydrogenase (NAD+) subunit PreA
MEKKMVDLSVEFAGLRFKNPVSAAAGPITSTPYTIRRCIEHGVGSVVVKSVSLDTETQFLPRPGNWFLDRVGERGGLMHCYAGLLPPERAAETISEVKPLAESEDVRLIGSFFFTGPWTGLAPFEPVSPTAGTRLRQMALELESAGAEAIEVVCSCGLTMSASQTVGFQKEAIPLVFEALEGHLHIPFWIKLGFGHEVFWLRDIKAMKDLGASAVHTYSDFRITFLDIETGKPPLSVPFGYGRWLRGPACYGTYLSAHETGLGVMSSGGIWSWKDAVERMMCGATLAALESPIQYRGYTLFGEILEGMTNFMERKGYGRPSDMIGLAVPHIDNQEAFMTGFLNSVGPPESMRPLLDAAACSGCGKCTSCIYGAVVMEEKLPRIDLGTCERCGVCATLCPTEALSIVAAV